MNHQYYSQSKSSPSALQVLSRPMLLISLGLHSLLLLIPIPSSPIASSEPKQEEIEQVKISELLAPTSPSSPKPSKASKPQPKKAASNSQQAAPKSQPNRVLRQTSRPTTKTSSTSRSTTETGSTTNSEAGGEDDVTSDSTTEAPEGFGDLFGKKLEGEQDEKLIDPNLFAKPESFYTQESLAEGKPEGKPGVERIKWISLKEPDTVLAELEPQLKSEGIQPTTQGSYGGGTVVQVKKGSSVRYISLVPTKKSIGTLIVVWNRNPNAPAK